LVIQNYMYILHCPAQKNAKNEANAMIESLCFI